MNIRACQRTRALSLDHVLVRIAARAAAADAGTRELSGDMALLSEAGVLAHLCDPETSPRDHARTLRAIGRASLSVGRLAEGHMNALRLVQLYGTSEQRGRAANAAGQGVIFGVWGADGDPPVRMAETVAGGCALSGHKRFASGLGTVGRAVVTAQWAGRTQLVIADVDDVNRADAAGWNTTGMRATASGSYDFTGVTVEKLGQPGDYEREPHFQGGVWRYAALQVGGLEALAEEVRLTGVGREVSEAQLHRIARIATLAHGARLLVEDAAMQVERHGAGAAQVALSLAAREAVEQACLDGIAIADRALGTRSFATGTTAERVRRDLAFFLRQADLDGKLRQVGATLCDCPDPAHRLWSAT